MPPNVRKVTANAVEAFLRVLKAIVVELKTNNPYDADIFGACRQIGLAIDSMPVATMKTVGDHLLKHSEPIYDDDQNVWKSILFNGETVFSKDLKDSTAKNRAVALKIMKYIQKQFADDTADNRTQRIVQLRTMLDHYANWCTLTS
jgi:hypothetical protein